MRTVACNAITGAGDLEGPLASTVSAPPPNSTWRPEASTVQVRPFPGPLRRVTSSETGGDTRARGPAVPAWRRRPLEVEAARTVSSETATTSTSRRCWALVRTRSSSASGTDPGLPACPACRSVSRRAEARARRRSPSGRGTTCPARAGPSLGGDASSCASTAPGPRSAPSSRTRSRAPAGAMPRAELARGAISWLRPTSGGFRTPSARSAAAHRTIGASPLPGEGLASEEGKDVPCAVHHADDDLRRRRDDQRRCTAAGCTCDAGEA